MAIVQKLVLSGMDGKVQFTIEYDSVTLAISRILCVNNLNRNERPTVTVKMPPPLGTQTISVRKIGDTVNVPGGYFMANHPEDGRPVLPYEAELSLPFGDDK